MTVGFGVLVGFGVVVGFGVAVGVGDALGVGVGVGTGLGVITGISAANTKSSKLKIAVFSNAAKVTLAGADPAVGILAAKYELTSM